MLELDAHSYVLRAVNGANDLLWAIRCHGALQHARDGRLRLWHSEKAANIALRKMYKGARNVDLESILPRLKLGA